MIGALRGTLLDRSINGSVVIDVNGVGYEVQVSGTTLSKLSDVGTEISLRVHTRVREDAITLFGFLTGDEKRTFDVLIGAHGVGPTVALGLLSAYSPRELSHIIAMDDIDALSKVPGIGKKTAQRLLVELKSRFDVAIDLDSDAFAAVHTTSTANTLTGDVSAALGGLGYAPDEIRAALKGLPENGTVQELLKLALKNLSGAH